MAGKYLPTQAPTKAIHQNIEQEFVYTTVDKLTICLTKHLKNLERKKDWIAPATLLVAIITTFVSSTFKDEFLTASVWKAIFILVGIAATCWLLYALTVAFRSPTVEDVVEMIKNTSSKT